MVSYHPLGGSIGPKWKAVSFDFRLAFSSEQKTFQLSTRTGNATLQMMASHYQPLPSACLSCIPWQQAFHTHPGFNSNKTVFLRWIKILGPEKYRKTCHFVSSLSLKACFVYERKKALCLISTQKETMALRSIFKAFHGKRIQRDSALAWVLQNKFWTQIKTCFRTTFWRRRSVRN